jgi:hypothetical protein
LAQNQPTEIGVSGKENSKRYFANAFSESWQRHEHSWRVFFSGAQFKNQL